MKYEKPDERKNNDKRPAYRKFIHIDSLYIYAPLTNCTCDDLPVVMHLVEAGKSDGKVES